MNDHNRIPLGVGAGVLKHLRDFESEPGRSILKSPADFITIGSVTLKPREGNPEPRYYFDSETGTSWNSVGLRGDGFSRFLRELPQLSEICAKNNKQHRLSISPVEVNEVRMMIRDELSWLPANCGISLLEINAACPNLWGHGVIAKDEHALRNLLEEVASETVRIPIALKIAPDTDRAMLELIVDLASVFNISAIVSGNTRMVDTPQDEHGMPRIGMPKCGMAGSPILENGIRQIETLAGLRDRAASNVRLIACGGIMSGDALRRYVDAGADEAQIVTGAWEYGGKIFQDVLMEMYA